MSGAHRPGPRGRTSWAEAVSAFLLTTDYTAITRRDYYGHLQYASRYLAGVALGQLTVADLEAYRTAVLSGRRDPRKALVVARVFLVWGAAHGLVKLRPEAIGELLRPPGAARGIEPVARTTRRRRGRGDATPAASGPRQRSGHATLSGFGYPSGVAGLALAAEEIHALREALLAADPERWGKLVGRTEHPAVRRPGGAAVVALDALRAAADTRRSARKVFLAGRGREMFLAGLGYEGYGGERRLLGALRDLRAAFAEQQRGTLARTIWQLRWTEVPIPGPQGDAGRSRPCEPQPLPS